MLCRDSGKVIHIDFGDCFEVATMREKYPEKVPFRLTRMLIGAMEVTGIEGLFRHTSVQIVNLMRKNRESLLAVLEAFIHDPLLQWVLHDNTKKGGDNAVELDDNLVANQEAVNELRKKLQLPIHPSHVPVPAAPFTTVVRNHSSRPSSGNAPIIPENVRIFTDINYPDSKTLRNPYSVNQWRHHLCNGPWLGCYNTGRDPLLCPAVLVTLSLSISGSHQDAQAGTRWIDHRREEQSRRTDFLGEAANRRSAEFRRQRR